MTWSCRTWFTSSLKRRGGYLRLRRTRGEFLFEYWATMEKKARSSGTPEGQRIFYWEKMTAALLLYAMATRLRGIASGIYCLFRGKRGPGALAPSVPKAGTAAAASVANAQGRLAKAEAKQPAVADHRLAPSSTRLHNAEHKF